MFFHHLLGPCLLPTHHARQFIIDKKTAKRKTTICPLVIEQNEQYRVSHKDDAISTKFCNFIVCAYCCFCLQMQSTYPETYHNYDVQRRSSLTPINEHMHYMNFDVLMTRNSYPQLGSPIWRRSTFIGSN